MWTFTSHVARVASGPRGEAAVDGQAVAAGGGRLGADGLAVVAGTAQHAGGLAGARLVPAGDACLAVAGLVGPRMRTKVPGPQAVQSATLLKLTVVE